MRTFKGICRMAGDGAGIGVIPATAARRCRQPPPITTIPLVDRWATRRLSVCIRSEPELTPSARSLFEHLAQPAGRQRR